MRTIDVCTVRSCGKLILLGEYAVLEEGMPCIVASINKHIYCRIKESNKILVTSRRVNIDKLEYTYENQTLKLVSPFHNKDVLIFLEKALEITLKYLEESGYELRKFEINILSDLNNDLNIKYGFGSSASVVVSTVGAILHFHGISVSLHKNRELIFKLSSIAHFLAQGSGSGVDVAASVFGGFFVYKSFSADWMRRRLLRLTSIKEMVEEPWKFFSYEEIRVLIDMHLCVGWTGKPSSTKDFIKKVMNVKYSTKEEDVDFYLKFLNSVKRLTEIFLHGIDNDKKDFINKSILANRNLLKELSKRANVEMETQELKNLVTIANKYGCEGKFSGAGGGDCGYAIAFDSKIANAIKTGWKKYNITPMDVDIDMDGIFQLHIDRN